MSAEPTRAVYVRMSDRLALKLDRAAERLGATKRDVVAALVNDHLDVDGDNLVVRRPKSPATAAPEPVPSGEVLTLGETAELLRVGVDDVRTLIEAGDLPARRLGQHWRLSRTAVLAWLREDGRHAAVQP
jgi:excisionase family DNA binding protein